MFLLVLPLRTAKDTTQGNLDSFLILFSFQILEIVGGSGRCGGWWYVVGVGGRGRVATTTSTTTTAAATKVSCCIQRSEDGLAD